MEAAAIIFFSQGLQPMSVPKARIGKLPFWAFSDVRDRFAYISMSFARIDLKLG
jgi:hypothetical protein